MEKKKNYVIKTTMKDFVKEDDKVSKKTIKSKKVGNYVIMTKKGDFKMIDEDEKKKSIKSKGKNSKFVLSLGSKILNEKMEKQKNPRELIEGNTCFKEY